MSIVINPTEKIVSITSPTVSVSIQELVNAIRDWEDELSTGMLQEKVIDATGKDNLGSVSTAITLKLSAEWQIQFWSGVGIGYVSGGNIAGGVGGNPIKPTGGSDTIIVTNQAGGVIVATGSGVTAQDKTDIASLVWEETETSHATGGTTGAALTTAKKKAKAAADNTQ